MSFSSESCCGAILLEDNATLQNFDVMTNVSFGEITLMTGSTISNFMIAPDSGFGGFNISEYVTVSDFQIGVNAGFCCTNFTGDTSDVTINQSLNNLYTTPIGTGATSYNSNPSELPYIDTSRTIQVIDLTNVAYAPVMFYLGDADFEGQTLEFILKGNGVYDNNYGNSPTNVVIYIKHARAANGSLYNNGSPIWFNWYPFVRPENGQWRSHATCTWTNGAWTTDNEQFD